MDTIRAHGIIRFIRIYNVMMFESMLILSVLTTSVAETKNDSFRSLEAFK